MGTIHDTKGCFYNALDDEPVFSLLGRDPCAAETVRYWVTLRQAMIGRGQKPTSDHERLLEASTTASDMVAWRSEATDPVRHGPNGKRWHVETVPQRLLVSRDVVEREEARHEEAIREIACRVEYLEARLQSNADRFLEYAENHFAKGTPESDAKGEINYREYVYNCELLWDKPKPKPEIISHMKVETVRQHMPPVSSDLVKALRTISEELRDIITASAWPTARKMTLYNFCDRIVAVADQLEVVEPATVIEAIGKASGNSYEDLMAEYRRVQGGSIQAFESDTPAKVADEIRDLVGDVDTPRALTLLRISERLRNLNAPSEIIVSHEEPAESDTLDVTDTPEMPPHRFTMFTKARSWAYGRGLEINPSHIPDMLDKMENDGYILFTVLGGVEPSRVGMIFRRARSQEEPMPTYRGRSLAI